MRSPGEQSLGGLAPSSTHLAFVRSESRRVARAASEAAPPAEPRAGSTTLVAGPLGGPFVRVAGSSGAPGECRPGASPSEPALSGSVLVYVKVEITCTRSGERLRDHVVVHDLDRPFSSRRVIASGTRYWPGSEPRVGLSTVRVAGRYVAWQENRHPLTLGNARVFDLRAGRVVRTVRAAPGGSRGDILEWFAVGRDGTLVVSYQKDASGHALALLPPSGPGRPVEMRPPTGTFGYSPRPSRCPTATAGSPSSARPAGRVRLRPRPPAGARRRPRRYTADRPIVADPAWSGRYAAWASRRGRTTTIWRSGPLP